MKALRLLECSLALFTLAAAPCAEDFVVSAGESIQDAIDLASDGDRVLVEPGVYDESIDFLGKAISVVGLEGPIETTIDATGVGGPVVRCTNGEGPDSVLAGFTITGGNVLSFFEAGAGINAWSAGVATSPTVMDCIVRDNLANGTHGGGVAGNPTLRRCSIYDNEEFTGEGGGVYGAPDMRFCVVASNLASDGSGGGIFVGGGSATIRDSVIVDNESRFTGRGGGIAVAFDGTAMIERCLIVANECDAAPFRPEGGAISVETGGTARVERCTIVGNLANDYVGTDEVGGVLGAATLRNTIVRDNSFAQILDATAVTYCDVEGGHAGTGNIDALPGYVETAARDYHLASTSPCIDVGDPATFDPDGTRADIGAFPFQTLYCRANATPGRWADPGWAEISSLVGGKQVLRVNAGPPAAGRPYRVLGSTSGTSPGMDLFRVHLPLNPDDYLASTLLGTAPLLRDNGFLDANGPRDVVVLVPPALGPFLPGTGVDHAAVWLDYMLFFPKAHAFVSGAGVTNAVRVEIE